MTIIPFSQFLLLRIKSLFLILKSFNSKSSTEIPLSQNFTDYPQVYSVMVSTFIFLENIKPSQALYSCFFLNYAQQLQKLEC